MGAVFLDTLWAGCETDSRDVDGWTAQAPAPMPMERAPVLEAVWDCVDPRLAESLRQDYAKKVARRATAPIAPTAAALVGQRAAGKSRLLPLLAAWTGLPACDLDELVERRTGRPPSDWFPADEAGFRAAERAAFLELHPPALVATGGGFLSNHADTLHGWLAVEIPITAETYRERLLADRSRPRLRPGLTVEEEIERIYAERTRLHAAVSTIPLVDFLVSTSPAAGGNRCPPASW